jgi:anti-anti-sigma factor
MPPQIKVPADFNAVVITSPSEVSSATVAHIQATAEKLGLPRQRGHRILFASQVEYCDSSAVAAMMGIMQRAHQHGHEFVVCNPSPIVRRYLEIYGASSMIAGHILYANDQGFYETKLMPFVPPYVPALDGRWDIYTNGKVKSFVLTAEGAVDTPPVDLNQYAIPTIREVVRKSGKSRIMSRVPRVHEGLVVVRRFKFAPEEAATKLDVLHKLLDWYKSKGFDFRGVFLWQSEANHGEFSEVLSFRDRSHYDAFKTLLKVDTSWKDLNAKLGNVQPEIHMQF